VSGAPPAALGARAAGGPLLIFVAGPNGAGKSTFFAEYLERLGLPYVNADEVARRVRAAEPAASREDVDRRAFREALGRHGLSDDDVEVLFQDFHEVLNRS